MPALPGAIYGLVTLKQPCLHITNGDSASITLAEADPSGRYLPWQDILHDGPVPGGLGLDELSEVRAGFLGRFAARDRDRILEQLRARDNTLKNFRGFDEVLLWFEHDLYDQLQILQLLHWFSGVDRGSSRLRMICIDCFPGVVPFYGLGQLNAAQLSSLCGKARDIDAAQLDLGRRGWLAFTSDTPQALQELLGEDLSVLPFLAAALRRHLEEFPDSVTGLSRHERQILEMVDAGIRQPVTLFVEHQKREAAPYLGDWGFWSMIEGLTNVPHALLQTTGGGDFRRPPQIRDDDAFRGQRLSLTETGRAVLAGAADWVALQPPDRWKGGVHLQPGKPLWRWHAASASLREAGPGPG